MESLYDIKNSQLYNLRCGGTKKERKKNGHMTLKPKKSIYEFFENVDYS